VSGFVALLSREVREILRDPFTLGIAFVMPVVLVVLFAYGVNLDVDHLATAVVDGDKSQESADYIDRFSRTGYFVIVALPKRFDDAEALLRRDAVKAVVLIPPGFSRDLLGGRAASAQLILDGSFPPTATVAMSYAQALSAVYSAQVIENDAGRAGMRIPPSISVESRVLYNPDLRTQDFIVPGLLGVILLAFPPLLSSLAVVRERERGSLMQLQIARVKPLAFVLAKLLPYVAVGFGELVILFALGTQWFGVRFNGPLPAFLLIAALYVVAAAAIGLLVSTFTQSQVVAMLVSLIATLMPSMLFSGFIFPIFDMPLMIQGYTFAFPARYFIEITRSMWLKGMPLENTEVAAASLLIYTVILIALAVIRTRALVKARG
jgi:ABC-2 type transport system permease protein